MKVKHELGAAGVKEALGAGAMFLPMVNQALGALYMRWRWSKLYEVALMYAPAGRSIAETVQGAAAIADATWEEEKRRPFSILPTGL